MRVAIAFEYPTLNGGEQSMLAALDSLRGGAAEFVALAPPAGRLAEALDARGVPRVDLSLHDEQGVRVSRETACRRLRDAVAAAAPDLVHANSLSMGRLTGAITDEVAVPTTAHLRDIVGLSRAAVADLNRNRRLIAVSQATRAFHVKRGLDGDRVQVLYNGVDVARLRPRPATGWLRRELGLPSGALLVAAIGQIGLRKGQDVLAEAAALAAPDLPHVHYLLIGERNSGKGENIEFERRLTRRFEETGLSTRLLRLGWRDDVAELLPELDLLVHPARQEPLGRVLLEAAAAELPIVATDVGGTREILEDGVSARLVPPDDPPALAMAMTELALDRELRGRLASAARGRIVETFSIESAAVGLFDAWRRVLSEQNRS
jgi:glycosyltransferase involved in cell wall biosynthesis